MRKTENVRMRPLWRVAHVFGDPSAPAQIVRSKRQSATRLHQHEFTEMVFILGGKGMHLVNESCLELEAGDYFVIETGGMHAYQHTHALELINVLIRHDVLERLRRVTGKLDGYVRLVASPPAAGRDWVKPRPLTPHELADCLRVIEEIEMESARGAAGWRDMQEVLIQELIIRVCRAAALQANHAPDSRARIEAVIRHLERNYADPVTVAQLGTLACMSGRTLQRHFIAATGGSPLRYLLRVRLAHASRLVRETDLTMTEIGDRCGMPNSAYFSRLFHRYAGTSPSAWRKRKDSFGG